MNIKLLNKLYTTHSPSGAESLMCDLVCNELDALKIDYKIDKQMQIYRLIPGTPLMVAHMDQVQSTKCHKVMSFKNSIYGFSKKGKLTGLGADDKNGIFVVLNMIKRFRDDISFIFSCNEERGGYLHLLPVLDELKGNHPYGLVFDRKGKSDIIGTGNNYCCDDFEMAVRVFSKEHKYKPSHGIFSDCDELSLHMPCVNLSVGYYNAHTVDEYTKPAELWRAIQLAETLLTNLPKKGTPFEIAPQWEAAKNFKMDTFNYKDTGKADDWDQCILDIDINGVYFYDQDLEEHFLGETIVEAEGIWTLDHGNKLSVALKGTSEVEAKYNGKTVEVNDYALT